MSDILMKCGHSANAKDSNGNPCCVICIGITPNAVIVEENKPDLTDRKATCYYCKNETNSRFDLPFFEYRPDKKFDKYYCGCFGWD